MFKMVLIYNFFKINSNINKYKSMNEINKIFSNLIYNLNNFNIQIKMISIIFNYQNNKNYPHFCVFNYLKYPCNIVNFINK